MRFTYSLEKKQFDPDSTFDCGQVFRWERQASGAWTGMTGQNLVVVEKKAGGLEISVKGQNPSKEKILEYLSLEDDLDLIFKDVFTCLAENGEKKFLKVMTEAYKKYRGLRLLAAEPFETTISYILSRNNSIPSISRLIYNISKRLMGEHPVKAEDYKNIYDYSGVNYPFPGAQDFLSERFLDFCVNCSVKLRYPANQKREILELSGKIASRPGYFDDIINKKRCEPWDEGRLLSARNKLIENRGIGNKVCDCIMLFSLNHLNAFPVDRWVLRFIEKYTFNSKIKKLSRKSMNRASISDTEYLEYIAYARKIFGRFCGYAGEYLFYYMRTA